MKLFTDSMIALHWLNSYGYKLCKLSVFVLNRLESINKLCNVHAVSFNFVDTGSNPSDCMTRAMSYKMLIKSDYITGPKFLTSNNYEPLFQINWPNPVSRSKMDFLNYNVNLATNNNNSSKTIEYRCREI